MSKKDKIRHHELKDAASVETRWIEPIEHHNPESTTPKNFKAKSGRKDVAMRENKKEHQHDFRHQHVIHEHDNKRQD